MDIERKHNGIDSIKSTTPDFRYVEKSIEKAIEKSIADSFDKPKAFVGYLGITKSGSVTLSTRKTVRYNRRSE